MVVLNRIYTRTGDDGMTSLGSGERRKKYDLRIEAYGTLDEVNAVIGLVRVHGGDRALDGVLARIQNDLFDVEADLCLAAKGPGGARMTVTDAQVEWLERQIDELNADLAPLRSFILPGGSAAAAYLHLARTVCRRAERLIVQVFSASYWSFLLAVAPAMAAARILGKRVILNYHSGEADDHLARWGLLVHPWLRLAHEIVVPSEYLREVFARHGYRARVIPNVVNTSDFRYRERRPECPHLVSTRNLERHYRVDNTLEAFALVQARYPQATLSVAGYGREETRLRELATSLKLARVRFLGRVAPTELPALLDQADVFVNSSIVDNQPVSVLEAFAAGLPVVSTPTGDIANMIRDGETGVLVPAGDPAAMAKAVISLFENPNRAGELARRARGELEKYTWAHVSKRWAEVYIGRVA